MPPEGEDGYGRRSYGEPYPDAYGAPYGERDEDEPYGRRGAAGDDWAYATDQTGPGLSQQGYADREFQWAVDALADPLSDPLPGQGPRQSPAPQYGQGYGQQDQGYAGQGYVVEAYGLQPEPSHGQPHGQQAQDPGRHEPRYQAQQQPSHQPAHRQQPQQQSPHQPQHPAQQQESGQELQQDGVSPWFRTDRQPEQAWDDGPQQGGATQRLSTQRPQPPRSSPAPPPSPSSPQTAPSPQPLPYRQQQAQQPQQEYGAASGGGPAPSYGGQEPQGPQPTQRLRTQQNRGPQQWHADRAGAGAPGPAAGGAPLGDPGTAAGLPVRGQHRQVAGWPGAEGAGAGTAAPAATASAGAPAAPARQGGRRRDARHRGVEGAFTEGDPSRGAASPGASSAGAGTGETAAMPVVEEPAPASGRSARRRAAESAASDSAAASSLSSSSSTASSAVPAPARAGTTGDDAKTNTTTVGLVRPGEAALVGRAARRRAAQRRSRSGSPPPAAPGTRLEARRAERARRPGPAIIASRLLGEVFISTGVLMLLFVAYQLWWTNVLAGQEAGGAAQTLQDSWGEGGGKGKGGLDPERRADDFKPGEGFAIIYLPKLDVRAPIAQGISKPAVLDKGLVGHYDGTPFRTGMPWDKTGNFALAAHRNTHGEPFRYINRLVWGDDIVVETATKYYTYKMTARLPSTSPSNTSVIRPVPVGSGFQKPGRYITLTTCTPEFTSKYRLIVWGKMVEERPRSKGKPDALVE